jgi:hypothetical protein
MSEKIKYIRGSHSVYTLPGSCQKIDSGRYGTRHDRAYVSQLAILSLSESSKPGRGSLTLVLDVKVCIPCKVVVWSFHS